LQSREQRLGDLCVRRIALMMVLLYTLLRLVAMLIWRANEKTISVSPVVPLTLSRLPRRFVDHPPSAWAAP
jgi:hypothetical protein